MSYIIIGIHGMGNKPLEKTLQAWWKASIREGLKKINKPKRFFNFEMFYWARYLHPESLQPGIKDKKHPLYIEEPYFHSRKTEVKKKPRWIRRQLLDFFGKQLDRIFLKADFTINHETIADFIIHHFFRDLDIYYKGRIHPAGKNGDAKSAICRHLAKLLRTHKRKKILLIAHSMGAIIAYDVLTQVAPEIPIDTFVTIGAPLGLPVVKSRIMSQSGKPGLPRRNTLKTPENVMSHWYNLSDLKDKIAVNYKLDDDFEENARHIRPVDRIVANDYEYQGEKNPHKAYGYLRAPEMAGIISDFLDEHGTAPFEWLNIFRVKPCRLKPISFIQNLLQKRARRSHEQR